MLSPPVCSSDTNLYFLKLPSFKYIRKTIVINITVEWGNSKFIWGSSLDLDNDILLWYRKCDGDVEPPVGKGKLSDWVKIIQNRSKLLEIMCSVFSEC